jgi:DNA-directed RNA polymerase subunit M/transcription elongation factor TFIIS
MFYFKERDMVKSYCKKCSTSKESISTSIGEKFKIEERGSGVTNEGNPSANYDNTCKKCGHIGAEIIDVGILFSDEDHLILLKCGKCGFSERQGRKAT